MWIFGCRNTENKLSKASSLPKGHELVIVGNSDYKTKTCELIMIHFLFHKFQDELAEHRSKACVPGPNPECLRSFMFSERGKGRTCQKIRTRIKALQLGYPRPSKKMAICSITCLFRLHHRPAKLQSSVSEKEGFQEKSLEGQALSWKTKTYKHEKGTLNWCM